MLSAPLLFVCLAAMLIVGAAIGYFSRPGPARLSERMRAQAEAAAAYREDAEDRLRAANQRAAALEDEAAALRSDLAGHSGDGRRENSALGAFFAAQNGTNAESANGHIRDDLTRIPGINAALNTRLSNLGVVRFEDLQKLSDEDEMALEQRLDLPAGLIARQQWRAQAAKLR